MGRFHTEGETGSAAGRSAFAAGAVGPSFAADPALMNGASACATSIGFR